MPHNGILLWYIYKAEMFTFKLRENEKISSSSFLSNTDFILCNFTSILFWLSKYLRVYKCLYGPKWPMRVCFYDCIIKKKYLNKSFEKITKILRPALWERGYLLFFIIQFFRIIPKFDTFQMELSSRNGPWGYVIMIE